MKYDFGKTEKKWQKKWREERVYEPDMAAAKKPFYNLMMFPYPSAEGLHVGNMYAFVGSDIYGRMKRMQGYDVFEPIGLDGFGIHSENYALKIGAHPMDQAKISEGRFYKQLESIGNGFAWEEKLETYDPEYYRWTQWLFIQMWRHGLAYRKKQLVNWCPSCKTVLADEQVILREAKNDPERMRGVTTREAKNDPERMQGVGACERCGTEVVKKDLEQWFFKITEYAGRLLGNLGKIDWSERVKIAQRNWIGKSEGALVKFQIVNSESHVDVFTTRLDTIFSGTFLVLAPEHPFLADGRLPIANSAEVRKYVEAAKKKTEEDRIAERATKTGVELKGVRAVNPASGDEMPVWIADFVLGGYGTGAVFADAHDERDFAMAKAFGIPLKVSIRPADEAQWKRVKALEECFSGEGALVNSGQFDGLSSAEAREKIVAWLAKQGKAEKKTQFRLRDWLISRQRYWGAPIPMVHCDACKKAGKGERADMPGWYAVPEEELPVKLPHVEKFRPLGTGKSPLSSVKEFYETKCPACGGEARRETDVSDTFLDSAWYYLGYLILGDQKSKIENKKFEWDKKTIVRWLPVDMYIGGAEHSVLHLLYSRFVAMALRDMKLVDFNEPFAKFRAHGLLIKEGAKMSKSKGNVVNPDEYIKKFGADTLRMYLMFLAPFEQGGDFRDAGILGVERFLIRAWKACEKFSKSGKGKTSGDFARLLHGTIKKVTDDIETLNYNTAVSALMILLNEAEKLPAAPREFYEVFALLLAPFAPHMAEEIWQEVLGNKDSVHRAAWPKYDPKLLEGGTRTLVIQLNGKARGTAEVPVDISEVDAQKLALQNEYVAKTLGGAKPKKVIYVPGRIINIVI